MNLLITTATAAITMRRVTSLVSVAKRSDLGAPIQVMPMDWAQDEGEHRDRQARDR